MDISRLLHAFRLIPSINLLHFERQVTKKDAPVTHFGHDYILVGEEGTRFWTFLGYYMPLG